MYGGTRSHASGTYIQKGDHVEGEAFEGQGVMIRGNAGFQTAHGTAYYVHNDQDDSNDCAIKGTKYDFSQHVTKQVRVVGTVDFVAASGLPVVDVTELESLESPEDRPRPRTP